MDNDTKQMFELILSRFDDIEKEVQDVRTELKGEIQGVRTELMGEIQNVRAEMQELRSEFDGKLQSLRIDFMTEMGSMRAEMREFETEVRRNTAVLERDLTRTIDVLYEAYTVNADKLERVDLDVVRQNSELALMAARSVNDKQEMMSETQRKLISDQMLMEERIEELERKIS